MQAFAAATSLLARGEAKCDDAGFGYDIVQGLLAAICNHEPFTISFGLKGFYYRVLHCREINQLIHNRTPSSRMSVGLKTP